MPTKKLSDFRNEKDLTQEEISKKLGISKSFYSKIEYGDRNASHNFIKKFKEVFPDADIDELFFRRVS